MTWREQLEAFGAALAEAVPNCYHYWRPQMTAPFLVWQEERDGGQQADNERQERKFHGTVDYYTKVEYDAALDRIETAMTESGAGWYLESVQFEDPTGLIHFEWVFEVL